jgi:uncharacterized Ntn-hydrolase superfamily protein
MTFSIVARCGTTGQFGVAISSSSPAVAARCAFARARVGAVATQNVTNPRLGPLVLDSLAGNRSVEESVLGAVDTDRYQSVRQVLAIGSDGPPALHCGSGLLGEWAAAAGPDCATGGNLLANRDVPQAMVDSFEGSSGRLADRLLHALRAGVEAGGEAGPVHSAGLFVVHEQPWPYVDLRVDWHDTDPISELSKIWEIYRPQADDYVTRAINPSAAPTYGVPGDE